MLILGFPVVPIAAGQRERAHFRSLEPVPIEPKVMVCGILQLEYRRMFWNGIIVWISQGAVIGGQQTQLSKFPQTHPASKRRIAKDFYRSDVAIVECRATLRAYGPEMGLVSRPRSLPDHSKLVGLFRNGEIWRSRLTLGEQFFVAASFQLFKLSTLLVQRHLRSLRQYRNFIVRTYK